MQYTARGHSQPGSPASHLYNSRAQPTDYLVMKPRLWPSPTLRHSLWPCLIVDVNGEGVPMRAEAQKPGLRGRQHFLPALPGQRGGQQGQDQDLHVQSLRKGPVPSIHWCKFHPQAGVVGSKLRNPALVPLGTQTKCEPLLCDYRCSQPPCYVGITIPM